MPLSIPFSEISNRGGCMRNTNRVPNDNPVIERIEHLLLVQAKTKKDLLDYLGMGNSAFTRWKYDNSKSYLKYIDAIANFLGSTSEYLLYGAVEEEKMLLSKEEIRLIDAFRKLNQEKRQIVASVTYAMADQI